MHYGLDPSAAAALTSTCSEKFNDTSSLHPPSQLERSNNNHLAQPIQPPPVLLPDLNSGRRETRMNDDNIIDWIVPKEEKVTFLSQSEPRANSFTLEQAESKTHNRRTTATYHRHRYHWEGQICCQSQVDGICVKLCHRVAGPVGLFNDRPICFFSLRRNIGEYFFNGICGVSI